MTTGWIPASGLPLFVPQADLTPAECDGDIRLYWNNTDGIGDWLFAEGDVQTGQDLATACLVSLFTDKLATPDFVPTDGTLDRRGWWADPYNDQPLGSNLWQLERAKKTRDTLATARRYAQDALQWIVDDGVAESISVDTGWMKAEYGATCLGIKVILVEPSGDLRRFTFGWAWRDIAPLAIPLAETPHPGPTVWDHGTTSWDAASTAWDLGQH